MLPRSIFLIVTSLMLTSCIYVQRYPSNWSPPLQSDTECAGIAGVYENKGEKTDGGKIRLELLLFPTWEIVYNRSITHVEINQESNDIIKVIVWSEKKMIREEIYSRANNDFNCESGWISINQPVHRTLSKFLLGINWGVNRLTRSDDGALIVRVRDSGMGLFAVIPYAESDWLWFRFFQLKRDIGSYPEEK